jgi:glycerol-3-phosphate acyltransferase PlsY
VTVVLLLGAFVLGAFPTGPIVARARGVDLRKIGSGNVGATNVGRALGKKWAVAVLLADALKGWLPVFAARQLDLAPLVVAGAGLAAVLGHMFSPFLRGRGGKGVATSFGAALALSPLAAAAGFGLYALLYAVTRISSVGSLAACTVYPALLWLIGPRDAVYVAYGVVVAVLVALRHKDNIKRLLRGEELRALRPAVHLGRAAAISGQRPGPPRGAAPGPCEGPAAPSTPPDPGADARVLDRKISRS